jgi:hypothetical protein
VTPLEIDIVLWYHTRAVDYRDGDFSAPAVREIIDNFRERDQLLEAIPDTGRASGDHRTYRLTERGDVFVRALTSLPLPMCQWIIPTPSSSGSTWPRKMLTELA